MNLSFEMLSVLNPLVPPEPQGSNFSGLEDEGNGIKGKSKAILISQCHPLSVRQDGTGAAARDGRCWLLPSVIKIFI